MATAALIEPLRPTPEEVEAELTAHVRLLAGPDAVPRPEQLEAVQAVVANRKRTLLVARTGFGKSAVYFSSTKMLRDRGWGPSIVISPLLALMRDQVAAAATLGLRAETINSANTDDWGEIEDALLADEIDLLLIAPERLANPGFRKRVFSMMLARPFALVCDEAHCISDWGHDFRPDYLRLRTVIAELPEWAPILATTATANQRVTDDVASQLGSDTVVLRTSLDRASLHCSVIELDDDAERLAWVADNLGDIEGSGIIYALTVDQAITAADWLRQRGHDVAAYSGSTTPEDRERLECRLRNNELKALVATSALGMGFDKSDMAFCIHLGLPPTPVAYYQQIGRAGRGIEHAEVIALPRPREDERIWKWFESVSMPSEEVCTRVLSELDTKSAMSIPRLEAVVNMGRTRLNTLLSILDVQGAVTRAKGGWLRSSQAWTYDGELADRLRELRSVESEQMRQYASHEGCRLRYLRDLLDDAEADDCDRCDRCLLRLGKPLRLSSEVSSGAQDARDHLRGVDIAVEPRRQWAPGLDEPKGKIAPARQARMGRALSRLGDGGWGPQVASLLDGSSTTISPELVNGIVGILRRWEWEQRPGWICTMPSRRNGVVIDTLAAEVGKLGKLPVHRGLVRNQSAGWQAEQSNSAFQLANVWGLLDVDVAELPDESLRSTPVLLIDDTADSRWTITVAAHLLQEAGSGPVLPFVLQTR
ncbi:MAG: helicase-related protein [Acidimicrobiia bacterium]|nr:helicase-related protein [Acidimicrobiia bacterium]